MAREHKPEWLDPCWASLNFKWRTQIKRLLTWPNCFYHRSSFIVRQFWWNDRAVTFSQWQYCSYKQFSLTCGRSSLLYLMRLFIKTCCYAKINDTRSDEVFRLYCEMVECSHFNVLINACVDYHISSLTHTFSGNPYSGKLRCQLKGRENKL